MTPSLWLIAATLAVLLLLSAFFSASETAFAAANHVRLKMMASEKRPGAELALKLSEDDDRLLTTILIGNIIVNIAATALATVLFTALAGDLGATLTTVVMTVLVLVFGEVTPKTMAKQSPERYACSLAGPLQVLMVLLTPADFLFSLLRRGLARFSPPEEDCAIEEELKTMVDEAADDGHIDEHESELIRSAIEFEDQDAVSVMTPRVDMTAIEDTASVDEALKLFLESSYSRIPVFHGDLDHIVGVLNEKDFQARRLDGCTDIRRMMAQPVFAPSGIKISRLLKLLQSTRAHLVILVDEFGGTDGIVTMEDVLEELVGEIWDEHDDVSEELSVQKDGSLLVDGAMPLTDLLDRFGKENPYEAETAGGWAAEVLGRIPSEGDCFEASGLSCRIQRMDRHRVTALVVRPCDSSAANAENAPSDGKDDN